MRCAYCHNPELVLGKKKRLPWKEVIQFLEERKNLLDGVVLSGGECTLTPDLVKFISYVRGLGYEVKLDTNGLRPEVLEKLLTDRQLDYVALDYKAPRRKFFDITSKHSFQSFQYSLEILCGSAVPFEVRTTVHTALLDGHDITLIMEDLQNHGFRGNYYIQNFQPAAETLTPLPDQSRKIDVSMLPPPDGFTLNTRNF